MSTNTSPLTAQLDTIFQGKRIVDPGPAAPPALATIFSKAGQFTNMLTDNTQHQRQQTLFEQGQADRSATNNAIVQGANILAQGTTIDAMSPGLASSVQGALQTMGVTSKAVDSGRLPASAKPIMLERKYTELLRDHPENAEAIQQAFKSAGYDHYLFRDAEYALKSQDDQAAQQQEANDYYAGKARAAGLFDPAQPFAANVVTGRSVATLEYQRKQLQDAAEFNWKANKEDRDAFEFNQKQINKDVLNNVNAETLMKSGQFTNRLNVLVSSLQDHPELAPDIEKVVGTMGPFFDTYKTNTRAKLSEMGADPATIDAAMKVIDDQKAGALALVSGPTSDWAQHNRAFQTMQDKFGLQAGELLPKYMLLSHAIGQQGLNNYLVTPFDEQQLKAVRGELQGLNLKDQTAAAIHTTNLFRIKDHEAVLTDLSYPEAKKVLDTYGPSAIGNANAVIRDGLEKQPDALHHWTTQYGNIALAAKMIPPSTADRSSIIKSAAWLTDPSARGVMERMISNPDTHDYGTSMMMASRASTAHVLETSKHMDNKTADGIYYISQQDGHWSVYVSKEAYDREASHRVNASAAHDPMDSKGVSGSRIATNMPPMEYWAQHPPEDLKRQAAAMEAATDHLVATSSYDHDLPSGMTNKELRQFYVDGSVPPRVQEKQMKEQARGADLHQEAVNLQSDIASTLGDTIVNPKTRLDHPVGERYYSSDIDAAEMKYKTPPGLLRGLLRQENKDFDPNLGTQIRKADGSPASSARGLGQFTEGTAKLYKIDPTDPHASIDAAGHYLTDLKKKYGSWDKAIEHYGTTARSNFPAGPKGDKQYADLKTHFRHLSGEAE